MNNELKQNLTLIANLDVNKILNTFPAEVRTILKGVIESCIRDAQNSLVEHSFSCVSKNPVLLIKNPSAQMFIKDVEIVEGKLSDCSYTTNIEDAYKFPAEWAENHANLWSNAKGESFQTISEKQAHLLAGKDSLKSILNWLEGKDMKEFINVSLWSGEMVKVPTEFV